MKTILLSLKNTILDRASSPIVGSFILSWLLINWRFIVIMIWGNGLHRIEEIETLAFPNNEIYWRGVIFPSISVGIYLLINTILWPFLKRLLIQYSTKQTVVEKNKIKEIENTELLSLEESIVLRNSLTSNNQNYLRESKEFRDKISKLETEKSQLLYDTARLTNGN